MEKTNGSGRGAPAEDSQHKREARPGAVRTRRVATTETDLRRLASLSGTEPLYLILEVSSYSKITDEEANKNDNKKPDDASFSLVDADALACGALEEGTLCFELRRVHEDEAGGSPQPQAEMAPNDGRVDALIVRVGIPPHIQGYRYLCDAVNMVIRRPVLINRITRELYPAVADRYGGGVTPSKVERSIRHAVTVLWNRGQLDRINRLFGYEVCRPESKPTNGEFIALLAGACREALKD